MATVKRSARILALGFAAAAIVFVTAAAVVDLGEPQSPDLADGAALAAGALGAIGLVVALRWWSIAGEQARAAAQLQLGFIVRIAVAELGLLVGILGVFLTGSVTGALIGLVLFLLAIAFLIAALNRVPEL